MEKYKLYIRQYDITTNDYKVREEIVETNDIYHEIGKLYSTAFTEIKRIDYQKIDEKKELQDRIDKAILLLDSYKLGKYDYALTPAGLLELEDILRGKDNE